MQSEPAVTQITAAVCHQAQTGCAPVRVTRVRALALGWSSESDEGSLILVLTEPPRVQAPPFEVRLVTSYVDHLAAIEVGNQGFAFSSADALNERRRARASFQSERVGRHSVRLLALDGGRPVATGRAWFSPLGRTWVAGRRSRQTVGGAP